MSSSPLGDGRALDIGDHVDDYDPAFFASGGIGLVAEMARREDAGPVVVHSP